MRALREAWAVTGWADELPATDLLERGFLRDPYDWNTDCIAKFSLLDSRRDKERTAYRGGWPDPHRSIAGTAGILEVTSTAGHLKTFTGRQALGGN